MRWTRREAGQKPSAAPVIEDVPFFTQGQRPPSPVPASAPTGNNIEQLQKAERVLGISHRQSSLVTPSNARQRGPQPVVSAQEPPGSDRWGTQSEQEDQPMDNARSANGGLKPWPSLQSTNNHASMHDIHAPGAGWSSPAHYASNKPSHQHQIPRQPSNSTLRSHYESSQPPFATLQPTSSATGRTMGLRKAKSGVAFSGDDVETSGRPLKSALKHPSHEPVRVERPANKKDSSWMPKFGSIFAKQQPTDRGLLQPQQLARNGSSLSVASASPSNARSSSFSQHGEALVSPAPGSVTADPTLRPKVFENDVYDSAKVHVRRPPKGIQNWFDGVDVSSDDEDQIPSEALPSIFSPYEDKSFQAAPQNTRPHTSDRRKEDHGRKGHRESQSRRSSRQQSRPEQNRPRNISDTFVEENAMAIDLARQRMQENRRQPQQISQGRRNSGHSFAPSSFSHAQSIMTGAHPRPAEYGDAKCEPDDRTGRSRVPVESVRSMSVYSEYETQPNYRHENMPASSNHRGHVTEASPSSRRQSSNAARPSMVKRSNTRDTVMTTQTSGSIPIHWSFDDPMPALPTRATEDSKFDHTSAALRRLIGRDNSVKNRSSRAPSSKYTYEDSVAGDTNNSQPSDISRMMAVTEEEMALLEMMRLKRAAMQKGDISEGAQQMLDREQDSHGSSEKPVQELAKAKEERSTSRNDDWAYDLRPDYDRIAGLGSLIEEDADERLRIERFLASQTPLEDVFPFPSPPPRSRESSIPHEFAQMEDLLLPRTYTPQPPEPRPQQEQEKPAKRAPKAPSTVSGASEFDADEAAQLEAEMRQFLGDDGFSNSSAFPLPPKSSISSRRASRRTPRANGMLAPVLPTTREEETTPPIPNRSPNRMQNFNDESVLPPSDRTMHLRADSQALRAFPPTINTKFSARRPEPPTPSDIGSERLSVLLGPNFEQSLDLTFPPSAGTSASQNSNIRYDSPSICTSQASPLTPTFPISIASADKHRGGVEIANNDTASGYPATYDAADQSSLRTSSSTKSGAHSHKSSKTRQSKALAPEPLALLTPATYNGRSPSRLSSTGSCMSASDDVLAAWAELGGVSDGLSMRSR